MNLCKWQLNLQFAIQSIGDSRQKMNLIMIHFAIELEY